jgi:hypothetical protein
MSMVMQTAEVGTYQLTIYLRKKGIWEFWIKQNRHLLVKSIGTEDCGETKRILQKHLYDIVMTPTERRHFNPQESIEWRNYLSDYEQGPEWAG